MEKKLKIVEFATLVGGSPKSIYDRISKSSELPDNEKLFTVKEKVKGREIAYIVTNDEQIRYYQKLYGKLPSMNGNYEENVIYNEVHYTENESNYTSQSSNDAVSSFNFEEIIDRLVTYSKNVNEDIMNINNSYNEKLFTLQNELITYKSKVPLLEDKASREGMYVNEINELKKVNEDNKKVIYHLIAVIVILLIILTGYFTYNIATAGKHKEKPTTTEIEQVNEVQKQVNYPQQTSSKKVNKKKN